MDLTCPQICPQDRPLSETVEESPEHPSGTGERCGGGRGHGVLSGDGLVVVGARDHIDDLLVVEVLGAGNGWDETDQHSIAHDLSFQACRAVAVPDRLATAGNLDPDPELIDAGLLQPGIGSVIP